MSSIAAAQNPTSITIPRWSDNHYWLVLTAQFLAIDEICWCLTLSKLSYIGIDNEGFWLSVLKRDFPQLLYDRYKFHRNYYSAYQICYRLSIRQALYSLVQNFICIKHARS